MRHHVLVQRASGPKGHRVIDLIEDLSQETAGVMLRVGAAYASVSGLRAVLSAVPLTKGSQWVIGLDDYLTHPSVLDVLASLPGAEVRIAGEPVDGNRFHPKVYAAITRRGRRAWFVGGSANLTDGGLKTNAEAVIALESRGSRDVDTIQEHWREVWKMGSATSDSVLGAYRLKFAQMLRARRKRKPPPKGRQILESDCATIDPSVARVTWIEVGNITGFQSEQLEIKAEQALFFGLQAQGGPDTSIEVTLTSGQRVHIPVRYRNNAMWRLNLPSTIPEVAAGLRPRGERSPFLAVFIRRGGRTRFELTRVDSPAATDLRRESELHGTLGRTTAREYGWF